MPTPCELFFRLLGELPERYGIVIHGFALMPNHYHLLLGTPHANISRGMSSLAGRYSRELNRRHDWDGPLFRARLQEPGGGGSGVLARSARIPAPEPREGRARDVP